MKTSSPKPTSNPPCFEDLHPDRDKQNISLYYREISKPKVLSFEEEASLAKRIRQNDREALNTLIRANLRFVVSVCRKYQHQGLPLCDLINEGNLGLIRAAKRFDESKQFKFISYAVWWIRQSILQALSEQSRTIKLPASRILHLTRINRCRLQMEQKLGRTPSADELAEALELEVETVESSVQLGQATRSLDAYPAPGEGTRLFDLLSQDHADHPDSGLEKRESYAILMKSLHSLLPREEMVLKLYFGIETGIPHSLEEISERMGLTRERVRQIKDRAISKMKHVSRSKPLFSQVALV